jgi:flagellar biosynthetic protein FliP
VNKCVKLLSADVPLLLLFVLALNCLVSAPVGAVEIEVPTVSIEVTQPGDPDAGVATGIQILLALTVLSLAPAIMIVMTSFTRIIIVLSILRHAFGMQQTPPNTVLISLALFLAAFNTLPALEIAYEDAYEPYMAKEMSTEDAIEKGLAPFRDFMVRQMREQDLALIVELSGAEQPQSLEEVHTLQMIPAFMLSELKTAFQIGVIIFLPFLLIDIVVASILMSMGMMMVPPMMISLPIKILMFVLIDGWFLVVGSLMGSFN